MSIKNKINSSLKETNQHFHKDFTNGKVRDNLDKIIRSCIVELKSYVIRNNFEVSFPFVGYDEKTGFVSYIYIEIEKKTLLNFDFMVEYNKFKHEYTFTITEYYDTEKDRNGNMLYVDEEISKFTTPGYKFDYFDDVCKYLIGKYLRELKTKTTDD